MVAFFSPTSEGGAKEASSSFSARGAPNPSAFGWMPAAWNGARFSSGPCALVRDRIALAASTRHEYTMVINLDLLMLLKLPGWLSKNEFVEEAGNDRPGRSRDSKQYSSSTARWDHTCLTLHFNSACHFHSAAAFHFHGPWLGDLVFRVAHLKPERPWFPHRVGTNHLASRPVVISTSISASSY
jgi:hypothetical protein